MEADKLKKLRQFYHSLVGQQRIFDSLSNNPSNNFLKLNRVEGKSILPLESEFNQLSHEFTEIIPPFDKGKYYSKLNVEAPGVYYDLTGIRTYLAMAIGRLQIEIDETSDTPVTEKRQFSFISDSDLRRIIERDYSEIQRSYIAECWKSVIILCGGAIEAILADLVKSNEQTAKASKSASKESDIMRWDLSTLINVSVELSLVSAGVEKLSHSLREYRNLVHPGNELRNKLRFSAEEAKIAVEVLNIVHRDLTK